MTPAAAFARLFGRPEAPFVLDYLKRITQERTLPPTASDTELRFLEGQRALVACMLSLIKQGQEKGE